MAGYSVAVGALLGGFAVLTTVVYCSVYFVVVPTSPSGVVRRLYRTGRAVTVKGRAHSLWDPSRPHFGTFPSAGSAVYGFEAESSTIHVRVTTATGEVIERSGPVPAYIDPDSPSMHRRRKIARGVIGLYVAVAVASFLFVLNEVGGGSSIRLRTSALAALGAVLLAWVTTHLVLRWFHRLAGSQRSAVPYRARWRRVAIWAGWYVLISAALGVGWRVDATPPQPGWGESFVEAFVFVLACGVTLAAATHHHNFIHHAPDTETKEKS